MTPPGSGAGPPGLAVLPVRGLPEVAAGDDLAALITARTDLADGDVVVVAQKVVSKAEGALAWPLPGEGRAAARRRLARERAVRVVADAPSTLIVETAHGLVCANAGLDGSNVPGGAFLDLPADPDGSARALRAGLAAAASVDVAVIVADSFGRPWRLGLTDVAIGVAGLHPLRDERGGLDRHGRPLEATQVAVADELAAAADLVRRKADGVPVVVVRGFARDRDEHGSAALLRRAPHEDLFRRGRGGLADALGSAAPASGAVDTGDLHRAAHAARRLGGSAVHVAVADAAITVAGPDLDAGVAAGGAIAALTDLGYAAARRDPRGGEDAAVVVVAGPAPPSHDQDR